MMCAMIALVRTICCTRLDMHIDPEMIGTEQKMLVTHCGRYVHKPMSMTTTTNSSTEKYSADLPHAHRTLPAAAVGALCLAQLEQ